MAEKIHVPIIGETSKGALGFGIIVVGGVTGYFLYKHAKSKSTASAATGSQYGYGAYAYGYGSGTNEPYGYGAYTYDGAYGYGGMGGGSSGGGISGIPGPGIGGYGSYGYGTQGTPAPTTNAQWMANAVTALTAQGYNPAATQAALGLYITGGSVSPDQASTIQAAISIEGNPPQPGSDGYPPAIKQGGGGGGGGQGGGGGNQVSVPNVVGKTAGQAHNIITNAGLHAVADKGQKATWIVSYTQPAAGQRVARGDNVLIQAAPKGK